VRQALAPFLAHRHYKRAGQRGYKWMLYGASPLCASSSFSSSVASSSLPCSCSSPPTSPSSFHKCAGDDDTMFFVPNALKLLRNLDHTVPLAITDNLW
jgi:hypothetical protein